MMRTHRTSLLDVAIAIKDDVKGKETAQPLWRKADGLRSGTPYVGRGGRGWREDVAAGSGQSGSGALEESAERLRFSFVV
jgi:hypothetical protein